MSKRLAAASLGLCLAALFTSGAEARLEHSARSHDTEAITSRNLDRNSTIYSARGEARRRTRGRASGASPASGAHALRPKLRTPPQHQPQADPLGHAAIG